MIFDTHAHYDDEAFEGDRKESLEAVFDSGVSYIVNCGASLEGSKRSAELAAKYPGMYCAIGVHPDDAGQVDAAGIAELEKLLESPKAVAVGEIGLDYHWMKYPKEVQKKAFLDQWDMADRHGLPVVIHSRDAAEDTYGIICRRYNEKGVLRADLHCYSYSMDQAREYVRMGLMFGVGGVVTFKNSRKLAEALTVIPMERILLETDCPYLAPEPFRGKRNDSAKLQYVAQALGRLKGLTAEEVVRITCDNAVRFYGIN